MQEGFEYLIKTLKEKIHVHHPYITYGKWRQVGPLDCPVVDAVNVSGDRLDEGGDWRLFVMLGLHKQRPKVSLKQQKLGEKTWQNNY